jgi:hypothetical protein
LALVSEVTTPTSALPPTTTVEVGSPSRATMPAGFGAFGVGDVDEADPLPGAVGVDERHAVFGRADDLGDGARRRVGAGGKVVDDVERRDPVEDRGLGRGERGEGEKRGGECAGLGEGHRRSLVGLRTGRQAADTGCG